MSSIDEVRRNASRSAANALTERLANDLYGFHREQTMGMINGLVRLIQTAQADSADPGAFLGVLERLRTEAQSLDEFGNLGEIERVPFYNAAQQFLHASTNEMLNAKLALERESLKERMKECDEFAPVHNWIERMEEGMRKRGGKHVRQVTGETEPYGDSPTDVFISRVYPCPRCGNIPRAAAGEKIICSNHKRTAEDEEACPFAKDPVTVAEWNTAYEDAVDKMSKGEKIFQNRKRINRTLGMDGQVAKLKKPKDFDELEAMPDPPETRSADDPIPEEVRQDDAISRMIRKEKNQKNSKVKFVTTKDLDGDE